MSCQRISQLLVESAAAAERGDVKIHLENCEECRRLLAQLRELEALRAALSNRQRAPEDFSSKVFQAVAKTRRWSRWKLMAAVFVGALGLALAAGQFSTDPQVRTRIAPAVEEPVAVGPSAPLLVGPELRFLGDQPLAGDSFVEVELIDSKGRVRIVRIPTRIEIRKRDLGRDSLRTVSY